MSMLKQVDMWPCQQPIALQWHVDAMVLVAVACEGAANLQLSLAST